VATRGAGRAANGNSLHTMVGAQRTYSSHEAAQRYAVHLASCDAAAAPGKRMLVSFKICACQASMAWLTALPTACALSSRMRRPAGNAAPARHLTAASQCGLDAAAPRPPRQKTATTRWSALWCRGRPQCTMTSYPGFCAGSSTVSEGPPCWNHRCDDCPASRLGPLLPERASRSWEQREACSWR
jgi:hypothetical protein